LQARQQKKKLPFDGGRHRSPALLITVNRFYGHAEQFGHLFLGFFQLYAVASEFFLFHAGFFPFSVAGCLKEARPFAL
jgi:hypothetical protein